MRRAALSVLVVSALGSTAAAGDPVERPHVTARLIAKTKTVRPGEEATVGLHLKLDEGWHVYWRNPGESGLPPSIAWELPEGFEAGAIRWPVPERIVMGPILNFGYEGEVVFPVTIRVPKDASGKVELRAKAEWLVCEETCISGEAPLTIELTVSRGDLAANPGWRAALERAQTLLADRAEFDAFIVDGGEASLWLGALGAGALDADFFPDERSPVALASPTVPAVVAGESGIESLSLERSREETNRLRGVVVVTTTDGRRAYEVDTVFANHPMLPPDSDSGPLPYVGPSPLYLALLVAALVGAVLALVVLWRVLAGTR